MKKFLVLSIYIIFLFSGCELEDNESNDEAVEAGTASIKVKVKASAVWGTSDPDEAGTQKNYVYLYQELGAKSNSLPKQYGSSSTLDNTYILIEEVVPGDYYLVAFYDYSGGSKDDNVLNRGDYYSIYNDVSNNNPYVEDAIKVTIDENEIQKLEMTLSTTSVLGKDGSGNGRLFMEKE